MRPYRDFLLLVTPVVAGLLSRPCVAESEVRLPPGVRAVWDLAKAYRESTPTRERICINGLWRWQPATGPADRAPGGSWGFYKVPGPWPGIRYWLGGDAQTVFPHASWNSLDLATVRTAWHQREITIPENWEGRRIAVYVEYLNSYAAVYVDGARAGQIHFPWGEVDITSACRPGSKHTLSLYVMALPLKETIMSFGDTNAPKQAKGDVLRRGLCGDAFLVSTPTGARIQDVKVDPSVREWAITFDTALKGLEAGKGYRLRARITDNGRKVKEFTSEPFKASALKEGRFTFSNRWKPAKLWDIHTPQNKYDLELSLLGAGGRALDAYQPVRFGFRELWIDGRDFRLNGTRLFCFVVPLDNGMISTETASYQAARECFERLKAIGVNLMYTHNYGSQPGTHLSFEEVLRAADDVGMLISLSQPHFGHYEWEAPDADRTNGYARHAEFYVRVAQNHPAVVMYCTSFNTLGYAGSHNPDNMDGRPPKRGSWAMSSVRKAQRAEDIVMRLDPSRVLYHHSSGDMSQMYTMNFYLNFVPIQERSDWFAQWAATGTKPMFLCEYGEPYDRTWSTYRGWYKGKRNFGNAALPWELVTAEWNAQFLGDKAYTLTGPERNKLRFEAKMWRAGRLFKRWEYPDGQLAGDPTRGDFYPNREAVWAMYIKDNWRAFRTWGLSAFNAWTYSQFWQLRKGVDRGKKTLKVDWDNIQRPGFSPDYSDKRSERMNTAYGREDWLPSAAAKALVRNNQPLLAYIGGKPGEFTSKGHNFLPGQSVEKQIIIINNSRETVHCDCSWLLALPGPLTGTKRVTVETGAQGRIPLKLQLGRTLKPGAYTLNLTVKYSSGQTQKDAFRIHVLAKTPSPRAGRRIALFDPKGETGALLAGMGITCDKVEVSADLSAYDMFVVGKKALSTGGRAPDITRVRDGLRVVVFEQTAEVMEKRFGFRVQRYGLRRVFARVADHPMLSGLTSANLHDWHGKATTIPARLQDYTRHPRSGTPQKLWCGIKVNRAYRAGNRGNVASVLLEKPARGDFLPIVDGGFALKYAPLMEYREGRGVVVFCQMDVTGRTENDPAAQRLARNVISYAATYKPGPRRALMYAGDQAGRSHLQQAGFAPASFDASQLNASQVLVVGAGSGNQLAAHKDAIRAWVKAGGHVLALGLDEGDANACLPFSVRRKKEEHVCVVFESLGMQSLLAGIGPADVNVREPREIDLVAGGATPIGNGVLALAKGGNVVFCQLAPWQFDYRRQFNLKRTFRHTSVLIARLLANMGAEAKTPLLSRFSRGSGGEQSPWLTSFYLDEPQEYDDPYRYFGW